MYDDYEFEYEYNNESYTYDLDEMCEQHMVRNHNQYEMHDAYEIDDEYVRIHVIITNCIQALCMIQYVNIARDFCTQARKRTVSVTLDIECYDDFPLEDLDGRSSGLEGDENVDVSIQELADIF